jgi:hypothetical protein
MTQKSLKNRIELVISAIISVVGICLVAKAISVEVEQIDRFNYHFVQNHGYEPSRRERNFWERYHRRDYKRMITTPIPDEDE